MNTNLLCSSGNKLKQFIHMASKVLFISSLALAFGAPVAHAASKKAQAKKNRGDGLCQAQRQSCKSTDDSQEPGDRALGCFLQQCSQRQG